MFNFKEFLRQLQERHVLRTAVLYLGAGWVTLEFIGFVVDNYAVERVLLDCGLLLIAVGFPIALIISWFHGGEGKQAVTRVERLMVGILLLVGVFGSSWILARDRPEARSPMLAPAGISPVDLGEGSLAVLPLTNRTGADSLDWLGPGLADMLTTNLAQSSDLRVVSAQRLLDLMRQAGRMETDEVPDDQALQIASQSGARTLVRGSFMAMGDDVRLDVQLIDLRDGTVTAAEQSRGSDVFALVDDVSAKLSSRLLGADFTPTELTPVTRLATDNLDAYRAYQEGLLAERRFLEEDSRSLYRRAVELDSTFAIAWLRLGMQANTNQEALSAFQNAERFKDGATERDRYMIEAMFAAAFENDLEAADSLLLEITDRYPEDKEARYQRGVFLEGRGLRDEGRVVIEEAVHLDPYYAPGINHLAYMAGRSGDAVGADSLSLRYLEIEPGQANPHDSRGEILEMIGRDEEAREQFRAALEIEPGFIPSYEHLVRSYLRQGDAEGARAALQPYLGTDDPEPAIVVRSLLGDTYVADGSYREAWETYHAAARRAEELGRNDLRLLTLAESGTLAIFLGEHDEAEAAFLEVDAISPLGGGALFGLLVNSGERGRVDEMREVRDSAAARIAAAPLIIREQAEAGMLFVDALTAWYSGDAETAVLLYDEGRERTSARRPAPVSGDEQEALALIEVGRAREALSMAENMERLSKAANRWDPGQWQVSLYLRGRALEALDEPLEAAESYEKLLGMVGDGARDITFFRDTGERLAALRESLEAGPSG
jgi:tetratricopeptide (TPR) repeat protein/TolB-like protein